jgi:hypothetical protein
MKFIIKKDCLIRVDEILFIRLLATCNTNMEIVFRGGGSFVIKLNDISEYDEFLQYLKTLGDKNDTR